MCDMLHLRLGSSGTGNLVCIWSRRILSKRDHGQLKLIVDTVGFHLDDWNTLIAPSITLESHSTTFLLLGFLEYKCYENLELPFHGLFSLFTLLRCKQQDLNRDIRESIKPSSPLSMLTIVIFLGGVRYNTFFVGVCN